MQHHPACLYCNSCQVSLLENPQIIVYVSHMLFTYSSSLGVYPLSGSFCKLTVSPMSFFKRSKKRSLLSSKFKAMMIYVDKNIPQQKQDLIVMMIVRLSNWSLYNKYRNHTTATFRYIQ